MKALAITHKGLEDITSLEINELIGVEGEIREGCVVFEVISHEDIALICYKAQSVKKVLLLLDDFKINSIEDLKKSCEKIAPEAKKIITSDKTFAVRGTVISNDDFERDDVCLEAADGLKLDSKVDLKNPDVVFFVYIFGNSCYIGIDFSGEDLSKRDYRIYTHYEALKATRAYALLRISDYKVGDFVLDPFCGSGTILIEAALFASGLSQNHYTKDKFAFTKFLDVDLDKFDSKKKFKGKIVGYDDDLRYIIGAKKNAKIAGIEKLIDFSKIAVEWLDTKIDEKSFDKIITNPPNLSHKNEKNIGKVYDEFFKQAAFVLKDDGIIALITKSPDMLKESASKHKFNVKEEREISIGKDKYAIIVFNRA